jgi:transcriptional regulator with XRE-family HTH domain
MLKLAQIRGANRAMIEDTQRQLLGQFVRAHRERARPEAPGGRRRTPGLRREELAAMAGMSTVWCAWIEQGRIQASARGLSRLATALALTLEDRAALFALADRPDPAASAPDTAPSAPASLVSVVQGFAHPAYALDRLWNACCWNAPAERLFPKWLGEGRQRNLLRYVFLDRSARALAPIWRNWAHRLLEEFRSAREDDLDDPSIRSLVNGLCADSVFFARCWDAGPGSNGDDSARTFVNGDGSKAFSQHSFGPSRPSHYSLVTFTPAA